MLHSAFDLLSRPPEAYVIVWALALGDAILPVLPSETALITAGLLSVVGKLSLGRPFQQRFLDGKRAHTALEWSRGQLDRRGGLVLIVARYVPGGRSAATFTCGITHYPYAKFAGYEVIAATSWAVYAASLGYFGGRFFREHAWLALVIAFAIAGGVTLAVEGIRRLRR